MSKKIDQLVVAERRDLNDSLTWARDHHHPRHSAFVAKVRAA
jgi:hypothetical protein